MLAKIYQKQQKSLFNQIKNQITTAQQKLAVPLKEKDPELYNIIELEKIRQVEGINLIASENHCSRAVLNALGTHVMNKYSDGYGARRLYPGTRYVEEIEEICKERALKSFNLDPEQWGVNVQAYSGCHANMAVYSALLKPHERILGLDLPHGGHLSHGFQTKTKKISMVSQFFESLPYRLDEEKGTINYDQMELLADLYNPKIIVAGASAYSRLIDYQRFKNVAVKNGSYLMSDMAHISGLVAAKVIPSPFDYSDIVTTTTHKSLRGPRGSIIFFRKGVRSEDKKGVKTYYDLEDRINFSVTPIHQSSPHNNQVAAIAVALKQASTNEFKIYQQQVLDNSQALCKELQRLGYSIVSGGTDNHLILINLKESGLDGSRTEKLMDQIHISANKNTVPGDTSALNPGGLRAGTPAMTTRGLIEKDFVQVAQFIDKGLKLIPKLKKDCGGKKIIDFTKYLAQNGHQIPEIVSLRNEIIDFSKQFPVPAIDSTR